jgi:hypothetical protein
LVDEEIDKVTGVRPLCESPEFTLLRKNGRELVELENPLRQRIEEANDVGLRYLDAGGRHVVLRSIYTT